MTDDTRPDPDELLSRISQEEEAAAAEEEKSTRGQVKIFFGACAGVGKTYAMLSAARSALQDGMDVVIGVVETHGRPETEKLRQGLPEIPPKDISYRGTVLKEFDLDAALARKPKLILLDELAHTNAPGSRHPKRWQDVEELLAAGIDIYSTLNVQHLESLNDVVARITGIWVRETVPDAFFDRADEISLVDIPSEDLLKRLKEGKVYIAPGAKRRAAQNFFKKSNLIALRELALRRTAERVDAQMQRESRGLYASAAQTWSGTERMLVCVGPDALSSRMVRIAKRTAGVMKAPWTAIYVENERHHRLSEEGKTAVDRTLRLAERMGGESVRVVGGTAHEEIIRYARAHGFSKIIVGKVPKSRWKEALYGTLADHIVRHSGDIDVTVVTGEPEDRKGLHAPFWQMGAPLYAYFMAVGVMAAISVLMVPMRAYVQPVNLVMPYLVGIVLVALRYGRGPAILATVASALGFNVLFIQPYYDLKFSDEQHWVSFIVLLLTGVLIGSQTARLRQQVIHARKRETDISAMYELTRELTSNRGKHMLADIAARHIAEVMDAEVSIWAPGNNGQLVPLVQDTDFSAEPDGAVREESAARWAFTHRQSAGLGTETLPSARAMYLPLMAASGVVGVIGVMPEEEEGPLSTEKIDLLETFAPVAASALERANAAELVERTIMETEGEKLRNILLSSVSHDLRTPLASITGAASTLLLEGQKITDEYRHELLRLIHEEGARLARVVTNLLDVTSLESGSVKLNKELYFIEELIGSALMRCEQQLANRRVHTRVADGLPLARMDGLLIEQVLINLLENVADHTPEDTEITITAALVKPDIHVSIADNGPGVPEGDEERIFDKFYAGARRVLSKEERMREGGMGLAICRGIITAHGGKIWAQNRPEGGALFTFTLPAKGGSE